MAWSETLYRRMTRQEYPMELVNTSESFADYAARQNAATRLDMIGRFKPRTAERFVCARYEYRRNVAGASWQVDSDDLASWNTAAAHDVVVSRLNQQFATAGIVWRWTEGQAQ